MQGKTSLGLSEIDHWGLLSLQEAVPRKSARLAQEMPTIFSHSCSLKKECLNLELSLLESKRTNGCSIAVATNLVASLSQRFLGISPMQLTENA